MYLYYFAFRIYDPIDFNRHSFYQTDSVVTIQIPIKNLKQEQVQVQTTDTTVKIFQ